MVSNTIGSKLGPETIIREYKTFAIRSGFISSEEINDIIRTKSFNNVVDRSVRNNFEVYIRYYLGKYAASMSRTASSVSDASLYIGVDDNGTVTGIPFKGEITENYVKQIAEKYIKTHIRGIYNGHNSKRIKKKYVGKIKFTVTKLSLPPSVKNMYYESIRNLLVQLDEEEVEWEKNMERYLNRMKKWRKKLQKYDVKLEVIANDPVLKNEFLEFCIQKAAHENVIHTLRSGKNITIPLGVGERKTNKDSFDFWITDFKENMMDQILSEKPKKPSEEKPHRSLFNVFNCMSPLIGWWNEDISYYLIKISLPMNINSNQWLEYLDNKEWVSCTRCEHYNVPCCVKV